MRGKFGRILGDFITDDLLTSKLMAEGHAVATMVVTRKRFKVNI